MQIPSSQAFYLQQVVPLPPMNEFAPFTVRNQHFLLNFGRSIFWEDEKILVLSDLHLGKAGHFRKSGIAIPQAVFKEDMMRLAAQIQYFKPVSLLIVGDLFHSVANKEHDYFLRWRNDCRVPIQLVRGNHDILKKGWYDEARINVHEEQLTVGEFTFTHDIDCCTETENYCFSGHIHPGIRIHGMARQSIQVPCFYFGEKFAVLPAFGKFTGTHPIEPKPGDAVFALADQSVIRIY